MKNLTINELYHLASAKGLVTNAKPRVRVTRIANHDIGPTVKILLDYKLGSESSDIFRQALGAIVIFKDLTKKEYARICEQEVSKHGRNKVAESTTAKRLLARDDALYVFRDDKLLAHPLISALYPHESLRGELYPGAGDARGISEAALETRLLHDAHADSMMSKERLDQQSLPQPDTCGPTP